jgi:hypothetical protein
VNAPAICRYHLRRTALVQMASPGRQFPARRVGALAPGATKGCMRLTSRKKRSAIVVVLFHDFAFDVVISLAFILSTSARILSVVSNLGE